MAGFFFYFMKLFFQLIFHTPGFLKSFVCLFCMQQSGFHEILNIKNLEMFKISKKRKYLFGTFLLSDLIKLGYKENVRRQSRLKQQRHSAAVFPSNVLLLWITSGAFV